MRPDNSTSSPELIAEAMVVGKAIARLKDGKTVSLTSRKQRWINRIIAGAAPLVAVIFRTIKPAYLFLRRVYLSD